MFEISFCIPCMGRLTHLQQTLPINLKACKRVLQKKLCEFVIINYNSKDGLDSYIKENFSLDINWIRYFHTKQPQSFNLAHARNIGIKLARGKRFCTLDADNYLDEVFVDFVLSLKDNQYAVPNSKRVKKGAAGRLAVRTQALKDLNGYDEDLLRLQDADVRARLNKLGLRRIEIPNSQSLGAINHKDNLRTNHFNSAKSVKELKEQSIAIMRERRAQLARNLNGWGFAKGWLNGVPFTIP